MVRFGGVEKWTVGSGDARLGEAWCWGFAKGVIGWDAKLAAIDGHGGSAGRAGCVEDPEAVIVYFGRSTVNTTTTSA